MRYEWPIAELLRQLEKLYTSESLAGFWDQEKHDLEQALDALQRHLQGRFMPKKAVGVGGSGIVIRLEDDRFKKLDKALKFPRPVPGKISQIADLLSKEVHYLSELNHPGIVKITYHEQLNDVASYRQLPFYLMDFIEGSQSLAFMRAPETTETALLNVLLGVSQILAHLHARLPNPVAHLDIKVQNILVTEDGRPILIDLGTCKTAGGKDSTTTVACTHSRAHPALVRRLALDPMDENRAQGTVKRSEIDPFWDVWSLGLALLDWLGIEITDGLVSERAIYPRLRPYTRKYLVLMAARILAEFVPAWLSDRVGLPKSFLKEFPIQRAGEVSELVERLMGQTSPLLRVPEFSPSEYSTIQAGPGTHVPKTSALEEVLGHPLFRRLSSITQLGLVSQVFPGAKHSRREHSIGTYANTRHLVRVLYNDSISPVFRQLVSENDLRTVLLLALLHDIGQFPLAHDLEEIDSALFSHSDLTKKMIKGEPVGAGKRKTSFPSFDAVFRSWGCSADRLVSIIDARATSSTAKRIDKLLLSLVSGPIDADKLDYLFRDARHADVPYPFGTDVDRLLRCLTTVVVESAPGGASAVPMVGVHAKGNVAAEFLTMARYAMFSQVYWHHTVRAQKSMLFRAVQALLASIESDDQERPFKDLRTFRAEFLRMVSELPGSLFGAADYPLFRGEARPLVGGSSAGSDLAPTDAAVVSWLGDQLAQARRPEKILLDRLVDRSLFKRLWVVSHEMEPEKWRSLVTLWDQLDRGRRHKAAHAIEEKVAEYLAGGRVATVTALAGAKAQEKIQQYTQGRVPWLLFDLPGARPGSAVGLHYVLEGQRRALRKDDRAVGRLQASTVWKRYAGDLRQTAGKVRIFCDPDLVDSVEASLPWEKGIQLVEDAIQRVLMGEED